MATLDRNEVMRRLPHRGHALFIDNAEVATSDQTINVSSRVRWDPAHPVIQGHFPGMTIVPGVFLIEAAAQLAGVGLPADGGSDPWIGVLVAVRRCLIHSPIFPGQALTLAVQMAAKASGMINVTGRGSNEQGSRVVTIDLVVAAVPASKLETGRFQ